MVCQGYYKIQNQKSSKNFLVTYRPIGIDEVAAGDGALMTNNAFLVFSK